MINLLPPEYKQHRRTASLAYIVALTYVVVGTAVTLGAIALATYNFTVTADISGKQDRIAVLSDQKNRNNEIVAKANFINDRISNRSSYQELFVWENVFSAVASATPTVVRLKSVKSAIDPQSKKVTLTIQGISANRRSVLLFRSKLSENKLFSAPLVQQLNEVVEEDKKEFDFIIETGVQTNVVKE